MLFHTNNTHNTENKQQNTLRELGYRADFRKFGIMHQEVMKHNAWKHADLQNCSLMSL